MHLEIIKRTEKDEILELLEKQFGITTLPYLLVRQGRDRIRAFSGEISKEELIDIATSVNIEVLGFYFGKIENGGIRLSIDATNLLSSQITKGIVEVSEEQVLKWMQGSSLEVSKELRGFYAVKHKEDFLGTGKASNGILLNFVPKDRRIKN